MNKKEKILTNKTYATSAMHLADHYLNTGVRKEDVKRSFKLLGKNQPKVVEIGCGNGRDASEILKYTSDYIGFDITEKFIEMAKEKNPEGKFVVADLAEFEFPKGTDLVFSFASLLHSDKRELKSVMSRVHKSLNPGGIFYISLKRGDKYHKFEKEDKFGRRFFYAYTKTDIEQITESKFETIYYRDDVVNGSYWLDIALGKL